MKKSIADGIEQYVKVLIAWSQNRQIQIQRTELAETFGCVPSQITYVLGTRFTQSEGYYTESRRGEGDLCASARLSRARGALRSRNCCSNWCPN